MKSTKFGIVINPQLIKDVDWKSLDKEKIVNELRKSNFKTPNEISKVFWNMKVRGDKKFGKSDEYYYATPKDYGGQLELGSEKKAPHYQMWVHLTSRITKKKLLQYLSQEIYGKDLSNAISVQILKSDLSDFKDYCTKDDRADLGEEYSHKEISFKDTKLEAFFEENPQTRIIVDKPYSYQRWLMQKILEKERTRKVTWLCDITGNSGKSQFVDMMEEDPKFNILTLTLDHYRSFKYTSARMIQQFIADNGKPPSAIIIDAPRDEETKFLHEIYGVLEEINNGRIRGTFQGKIIKEKIPFGTPIIIFSNTPPVLGALSMDRWDIKALFRSVDGTDILAQDATVNSNVKEFVNNTISWQNVVQTTYIEKPIKSVSDEILTDMAISNFIAMQKKNLDSSPGSEKCNPGYITSWGEVQTAPTSKAPSYVQYQAQRKISFIKKQ